MAQCHKCGKRGIKRKDDARTCKRCGALGGGKR